MITKEKADEILEKINAANTDPSQVISIAREFGQISGIDLFKIINLAKSNKKDGETIDDAIKRIISKQSS